MKFQFKEGGSPEDDLDNLLSLILEILPSMEEKTFSPVERLPLRLPKTAREKHLNLIEEKFPKKIICRELRVLGTDILDRFCYSNPLSKLMTNLPTNAFIMEFVSKVDRESYQVNEFHQSFICNELEPMIKDAVVFDMDVGEGK